MKEYEPTMELRYFKKRPKSGWDTLAVLQQKFIVTIHGGYEGNTLVPTERKEEWITVPIVYEE